MYDRVHPFLLCYRNDGSDDGKVTADHQRSVRVLLPLNPKGAYDCLGGMGEKAASKSFSMSGNLLYFPDWSLHSDKCFMGGLCEEVDEYKVPS